MVLPSIRYIRTQHKFESVRQSPQLGRGLAPLPLQVSLRVCAFLVDVVVAGVLAGALAGGARAKLSKELVLAAWRPAAWRPAGVPRPKEMLTQSHRRS